MNSLPFLACLPASIPLIHPFNLAPNTPPFVSVSVCKRKKEKKEKKEYRFGAPFQTFLPHHV